MSNFNNASLIVTPNSVKAGKLYSIKPTSGAGDLDVVRATSATRVNEQGLVEIPRTNLLLRSEEFDNVSWNKLALSVIVNSTTAPNGTNTADTILADGTNNTHRVAGNATVVTGTLYTISVYAKKNTNNFLQIYGVSFPADFFANFNLDTGTIGTVGAGATATITNIGNGWYRCTATGTPLSTGVSVAFNLINSITAGRAEGSTLSTSVYLWGAQLEQGVTATEYISTTSVIRTRFAGITQDGSSASNIPRLDYTNGSCPSILVEPQRTNLVFPSNTATTQTRTVTAAAHTLSFYGTGSVTLSGVATGTLNGTGANNRVALTFTPTAGSLVLTVTGSVTNWQLEAGSNATSLIQTVSTSVTRNADVIYKTGISSLIGQTEGTIYCEFYKTNITEGIKTLISIKDGTFANNSIIVQTSNNASNISLTVIVNSTFYSSPLSPLLNGKNKIIVTYNTSGSKLFLNGVLAVSVSNIGLPVMDRLYLGNYDNFRQWGAGINNAFISKTAISDVDAIQLTTL